MLLEGRRMVWEGVPNLQTKPVEYVHFWLRIRTSEGDLWIKYVHGVSLHGRIVLGGVELCY